MADDEAGTVPTGEVTRVAVRIFFDQRVVMEKFIKLVESQISDMMETTAKAVAGLVMDRVPFMIEFEFLDMPDPKHRFARVGTDPRGMKNPVADIIDLTGGKHGAN